MPFLMNGREVEVRVLKDLYKWNDDVLSWLRGPRPGSKFILNGRTLEYFAEETKSGDAETKDK